MQTQVCIKAAQQLLAAVQQGRLGAQTVEDGGELHGDIASAHDHHPPGQMRQMEGLVRADGMLHARNIGQAGRSARCNQDMAGMDGLAVHQHAMRPRERRTAMDKGNACAGQHAAVDTVQALDFAVLVGNQRGPVEARLLQLPAKAPGLLGQLAEVRGMAEQLLGDAAHVDAGTAQLGSLHHSHTGPQAGSHTAGAHAARATAYDQKIVIKVLLLHVLSRCLGGSKQMLAALNSTRQDCRRWFNAALNHLHDPV